MPLGKTRTRNPGEDLRRATLRALLQTYFTNGLGGHQRRASKNRQHVESVFAKVLNKPVLDIERAELQLIADNWPSVHGFLQFLTPSREIWILFGTTISGGR